MSLKMNAPRPSWYYSDTRVGLFVWKQGAKSWRVSVEGACEHCIPNQDWKALDVPTHELFLGGLHSLFTYYGLTGGYVCGFSFDSKEDDFEYLYTDGTFTDKDGTCLETEPKSFFRQYPPHPQEVFCTEDCGSSVTMERKDTVTAKENENFASMRRVLESVPSVFLSDANIAESMVHVCHSTWPGVAKHISFEHHMDKNATCLKKKGNSEPLQQPPPTREEFYTSDFCTSIFIELKHAITANEMEHLGAMRHAIKCVPSVFLLDAKIVESVVRVCHSTWPDVARDISVKCYGSRVLEMYVFPAYKTIAL